MEEQGSQGDALKIRGPLLQETTFPQSSYKDVKNQGTDSDPELIDSSGGGRNSASYTQMSPL